MGGWVNTKLKLISAKTEASVWAWLSLAKIWTSMFGTITVSCGTALGTLVPRTGPHWQASLPLHAENLAHFPGSPQNPAFQIDRQRSDDLS